MCINKEVILEIHGQRSLRRIKPSGDKVLPLSIYTLQ